MYMVVERMWDISVIFRLFPYLWCADVTFAMASHGKSCSCALHDSGAGQTLQVNRRDEIRVSHFRANML